MRIPKPITRAVSCLNHGVWLKTFTPIGATKG